MTGSRRVLFAVLGIFLVSAFALAIAPNLFSGARQRITQPLGEILPRRAPGWTARDAPLAESAEMRNMVERILSYDDVVYRSYTRNGVEVQIYAAYWKPGSVPYGQAGVHTPDTCWVNAGWTMTEKTHSRTLHCGGENLKPGEWRSFSAHGAIVHVVFWHLVGGRVHTYEQTGWRDGLAGFFDRIPNLFHDLYRYGLNLKQEQLFVRVSSKVPFEQLLTDPAFVELMRHLRPLGVFDAEA